MSQLRRYPIPTRRYPPEPALPSKVRGWPKAMGLAGAAVLGTMLLLVVFGPMAWPLAPDAVATGEVLRPPSFSHPLGTDHFGRDMLARVLHGGRLSLGGAVAAVSMAAFCGSVLGLLAGYEDGLLDLVLGAAMEALLALPGLLLALVLTWLLGQGMRAAILSVGVAGIPMYFRVARAAAKKLRRAQFVRAAHAIGASWGRVMLRHVLPNAAGPLWSIIALDIGWSLLHLSAISFLGVGAKPPQAEWGQMLSEARLYLRSAPWLALWPGLAISLAVLAASSLAEAIQDNIDPLRAGWR
jgi:peptide/nickel transport system permease protein